MSMLRWMLALMMVLSCVPVAVADEVVLEPTVWGIAGPSPYYVPDGLQSPLRTSGLHLGGDMWVDTGYESSERGLEGEPDMQFWLMQGRFMLDATATLTNGRVFGQAKAQILAHVEEIPGN